MRTGVNSKWHQNSLSLECGNKFSAECHKFEINIICQAGNQPRAESFKQAHRGCPVMGWQGLCNAETLPQEPVQKAGCHKTVLSKDTQQSFPLEKILAALETH